MDRKRERLESYKYFKYNECHTSCTTVIDALIMTSPLAVCNATANQPVT